MREHIWRCFEISQPDRLLDAFGPYDRPPKQGDKITVDGVFSVIVKIEESAEPKVWNVYTNPVVTGEAIHIEQL